MWASHGSHMGKPIWASPYRAQIKPRFLKLHKNKFNEEKNIYFFNMGPIWDPCGNPDTAQIKPTF